MQTLQNLRHELDGIETYLKAVQETVEKGHMPSMIGLDKRVAAVCAAIEETEDTAAKQECVARLRTLVEKLNSCENAMRKLHETKQPKNLSKKQ